jgi:UDP-glucose 4-epimerase
MSASVLLTGGFGYVGGRLAESLGQNGFNVAIQTRRSRDDWPTWARAYTVIEADLLACVDSLAAKLNGIDTVVHLAAPNEIESADVRTAFEGTIFTSANLVAAAAQAGVRRLLYLSTAHIYGSPLAGRITELTVPSPRHPYAIAHLAAEHIVLGSNVTERCVIRLSNGMGVPREATVDRWTLVFNDLCRQAVESGEVVIRSSSPQRRDYVPLSEVCRGIEYLLNAGSAVWAQEVLNLGGRASLTLAEVAELVVDRCENVLGFRPAAVIPPDHDDARSLDYRCDRIEELGFKVEDRLVEEVDATLRFCNRAFSAEAKENGG